MSQRLLVRALSLALALGVPATAQVAPGFELVEINAAPGPLDPGVDYTFVPVGDFAAEAAGISVADVNNDSFLDMLICGSEGNPNRFFLNQGDGTFAESAAAFGIQETERRRGVSSFFDYDNDGDLDLITCGYPGDVVFDTDLYSLYRNDGPLAGFHFTEVTASAGGFALAPTSETTELGIPGGCAVADYDRDGFLDVIVTYWYKNNPVTGYDRDQFRLWRNVPNPVPPLPGQTDWSPRLLVDATLEAGLDGAAFGQVWMPCWTDFDRDGWPDLHINVETQEDELRLNNRDGTFGPNIATAIGMNFNTVGPLEWGNEMGVAFADIDNDGDIDTYHTNASIANGFNKADAFYRNDSDLSIGGGGLKFTHIGPVPGVDTDAMLGVGWGTAFVDLDNDADRDLIVARGLGDLAAVNYLFENRFPQLALDGISPRLVDISATSPEYSNIGGTLDTARSMIPFDFDNDGDLDVAYTRTENNPPSAGANVKAGFFLNQLATANRSLQLDLREAGGSLNAVGARVFLRTGGVNGRVQMAEVRAGSSYLGQEPYRLHFGLGAATGADWVSIRWFDGAQHVIRADGPPLAGFRSVLHGAHDFTGELQGNVTVAAEDLQLFVLGIAHGAQVDAAVPAWPWRQTADADGNGLLDTRDFGLLRPGAAGPVLSLGNGLAGSHGVPAMEASGDLLPGSTVTLTVTDALEDSSWLLILGSGISGAAFKGGVLVPSPDIALGPFTTGPAGAPSLAGAWQALPAGSALQLQAWISDPAATAGYSATNGLSLLAP
jgi:enediyne biosynthesis protein E4